MEKVRESVVLIDAGDGTGSGFVVDTTGYILTNEHVVRGSTWVSVILDNGDRLTAYVAATDASRDIALIKVNRHFHTVLQFATEAREGEEVIAFGYPFGHELGQGMTITTGIVSALRTYDGVAYVQTNTDLNFGNSGGPLLNLQGEVVGMNAGGLRDRDAQGINFAIRYDVLTNRLPVLRRTATRPPTATPTPTPTPAPQPIFGPVDGEIEHRIHDTGFIDVYYAPRVSMENGIVEARFFNPYSSTVGKWNNGFIFRAVSSNFHVVFITENGYYYHYLRKEGQEDDTRLAGRHISEINTGRGENNHIRIVADGKEGKLYINRQYVANLQLQGHVEAGGLYAVATYFNSAGVDGYSTQFRDFTIWPISALR